MKARAGAVQSSVSGQQGLGLVEIMISMTLGLIITGAIVQVYSTTKQQSDMQTSLTGRQEAVRFAAMIIQGDAQMAGYRGCLRDLGTVVNTLNNAGDFLYNYGQHVTGFENAGNLPGAIADVQPGTDVLTLRVAEDTGLLLQTDMLTSSADPVVSPNLQASVLASQDIALLADCSGAVVFQVHTYHSGTGMLQHAATGTPAMPPSISADVSSPGRRYFACKPTPISFVRVPAALALHCGGGRGLKTRNWQRA